MTRELDNIREMLRSLADLRAHSAALAQRLPGLTRALEEERWLDPSDAEELAGQLRRFALSQRTLLAWVDHALEQRSPDTMEELRERLTRREQELAEQDRMLRPCQAFLTLHAEEATLKDALTSRQEALRRTMEDGGDLEMWSRGCAELLEQLTARDYGHIGTIMDQYGALFDFPLVAGVYSGAITAPEEDASTEEPSAPMDEIPAAEPRPEPTVESPAEEPPTPMDQVPAAEPRPEPTVESPAEEPPAPMDEIPAAEPRPEPTVESPAEEMPFWPGTPAQSEAGALTFTGPRRFEAPSGKKFQDMLRRPDFRQLYHKLRLFLIVTGEEHRAHPEFTDATLRHAVREGYVTQVATGTGRTFYFASPKLLSAVRKSSVQRYMDSVDILPLTSAPEEADLSPQLLEQPEAVYHALQCLYDDQSLENWQMLRLCKWQDRVCYETYLRFEHAGLPPVFRRIVALSDPGADRRASFLETLSSFLTERTEPVWAVVLTGAEVPRWREYLTARGLPVPFWLPLDAPGQILSPEGEAGSLCQFFAELSASPEAETAPDENDAASGDQTAPDENDTVPGDQTAPEENDAASEEDDAAPGDQTAPGENGAASGDQTAPDEDDDASGDQIAPEEDDAASGDQTAPESTEEVCPGLFTRSTTPDDLWRQAVEWFAGEDFQLGLCLLRVLRDLDKRQTPRCLPFVYALDDPAEPCQYLPDRLTQVYADAGSGLEGDTLSCLTLSAYLRMAFTAEAGQAWYQAADALQSMTADPLVDSLPPVRAALELLVRTLRERRRGFEPQLIRQCQMWGDIHQKTQELSRTARSILDGHYNRVDVYTNRIKSLFEALFGNQSALKDCLSIVEQNDAAHRGKVQDLCAALLDGDGHPDQRAIYRHIDRVWDDQPSKYKQKESLKGKARSLAFSRFHTCLDVCAQWLECSEAAAIGQEKANLILADRDRLLDLFREAGQALERRPAAGDALAYSAGVVLRFTLDELVRSLQGEPVDRHGFYTDFLRTGQVELNADLLPVFEAAEYIIPGFEPWERLAEHRRRMLAGEGTDWDSVLERIWSGDRTAPDCYNFGTARCIEQVTTRQGQRPELLDRADIAADIRQVTGIVDEEELQFRARLELAATYGQIEDYTRKEQLSNAVTEVLRAHYEDSSNWGFYRRTMEACLDAVQREAERLEPRYRYEFDQLKEQVPPCPMFDKIEQLLQEKMFSVAHDYMQLVAKENITVPPESNLLQKPPEQDHLRRFLREQYAPLNRLCTGDGSQGRTLEHIYNQFAGDAGQDKNSTKRSARAMIRAWPRSNNTTPEMVQELLRHLSFQVRRVTRGGDANSFRAEMEPVPAHVFTHPHPIAAFGTQLAHTGLNVRILSGRKTADELVDLINRLGRTDTPTLFLLDYALPLPERNAMARKLKQESAHLSTCLVLDRILALFLTGYPDAERGKVFLQCALPFHFYNPYVKGDTPIPPEMFMGRKAQLEEIIRNGGANIIYGGRQLGKTALLRRAADLEDDREKGHWAVYTDVLYRCDYPEALEKLYACLTACGLLNAESTSPRSWEELCERIRARMDDPARRVERFLLLMDEADQFLASSAACSYRPVECLHQLQTATKGRFKYVLAGLHNVMRFSREATRNNSVLGKLGTLTIKPLTYQEASQLLEEPLYYLGFRLDKDQTVLLSQILLSTNYYPGLIHFYCAQLVESLCTSMGNADACPPYRLDENQIRVLLQKKDFTAQIRDKFFITLDVEEDKLYYRILAYALAYCYYDQPESAVRGYTFQDIRGVCREFSITSITALEPASVQVLLSEMEELNVLVCMNGRYTFNGANFRHMMGDYETVFDELDRFSGEVE